MKKIKLDQAKPYDAPGHFKMVAMRLSGKEETGAQKFWVSCLTSSPVAALNGLYEDSPPRNSILFWKGNSRSRPRQRK